MAPNTGAVQVIWVVEFSREGYKIRLIFGQNSTSQINHRKMGIILENQAFQKL